MTTGLHGLHVLVGTIFLAVCLYRIIQNHLTSDHHVGLEAALIYWHFVGATVRLLIVNFTRLFFMCEAEDPKLQETGVTVSKTRPKSRKLKMVQTVFVEAKIEMQLSSTVELRRLPGTFGFQGRQLDSPKRIECSSTVINGPKHKALGQKTQQVANLSQYVKSLGRDRNAHHFNELITLGQLMVPVWEGSTRSTFLRGSVVGARDNKRAAH